MNTKRIYIFVLTIGILLTACQQLQIMDAEPFPQVAEQPDIEYNEQEQLINSLDTMFSGEMHIHWEDGDLQYGSRFEGNNLVIYAIEGGGSELTQLTVFQPWVVERGLELHDWNSNPQWVHQFGVTDDYIIASVGETQGSGRYFYGDLFRIRRDGSGRESFGFESMSHTFFIIDGWIYHDYWSFQSASEEGWYRFRLDGTNIEFVGDVIHRIFLFGEDGYIYGIHAASGEGNLARWRPESAEPITLFLGESAPSFEEYNSSMSYWNNITVTDEYVLFTVIVSGYRDGHWRSSFLYTADYRVDKDGGNLTLLGEEYH